MSCRRRSIGRFGRPDGARRRPADDIGALKHAPGQDIAVSGSGTLIRSLLEHDLLDELHLLVTRGHRPRKRLFAGDTTAKSLKRTICKAFGSGVVHLCYEPVPG